MGKIFCLMGKSSSGKDTIFKKLQLDKQLDLKPIVSYTTRPMRQNEVNGIEYYFITKEVLEGYQKQGKIIEQRVYHTVYGDWYYCTVADNQINLDKNDYLLIVTLEAYNSLREYFGQDKVIPLYVDIEDGIRLERALAREKQQDVPNYNELCRRFLADNVDFSKDHLDRSGVTNVYMNNNLEECVEEIKLDILKYR